MNREQAENIVDRLLEAVQDLRKTYDGEKVPRYEAAVSALLAAFPDATPAESTPRADAFGEDDVVRVTSDVKCAPAPASAVPVTVARTVEEFHSGVASIVYFKADGKLDFSYEVSPGGYVETPRGRVVYQPVGTSREEFEKVARDAWVDLHVVVPLPSQMRPDGKRYWDYRVETAWRAWKAARGEK